jgi:D-sedoheptulose 7-phosphate isomerase
VEKIVQRAIDDLTGALAAAGSKAGLLVAAARAVAASLVKGGIIYICGNGGSAAEAQHFAAEFVGRFLVPRSGLAAQALTADTSKLTAIGNDYGFEEVFARQIKALGKPGDVLWAITTSGTSPNVLKALKAARQNDLKTILMRGADIPGETEVDFLIDCPAPNTPRIQELHLLFGHIICQLVDYIIVEGGDSK